MLRSIRCDLGTPLSMVGCLILHRDASDCDLCQCKIALTEPHKSPKHPAQLDQWETGFIFYLDSIFFFFVAAGLQQGAASEVTKSDEAGINWAVKNCTVRIRQSGASHRAGVYLGPEPCARFVFVLTAAEAAATRLYNAKCLVRPGGFGPGPFEHLSLELLLRSFSPHTHTSTLREASSQP